MEQLPLGLTENPSNKLTPNLTDAEIETLTLMPKSRKFSIPLWEAKWDQDKLRERRVEITPRAFERGYRQRPVSDEELVFSAELIDAAIDEDQTMPDHAKESAFWEKGGFRDAGVDLAIAEASADGSQFVVLGLLTTPDWFRWVMHVTVAQGISFLQQVEVMKELHERYSYGVVKVENNNYQKSIVQMMGQTTHVPVEGIRTGVLQKTDFQVGVPSLAGDFSRGKIKIPYGNAASRRQADILIEQLKEYSYDNRGQRDDTVLALYFAREARSSIIKARPRVMSLNF